jgi:hypothetical protein
MLTYGGRSVLGGDGVQPLVEISELGFTEEFQIRRSDQVM